jgi:hypothetical protein
MFISGWNLMPEHYTKSTVAAQAFCPRCMRVTMHRVDFGRKGPCLVCIEKLEKQHRQVSPIHSTTGQQGELFK